jgi:hypothetical protein
VATADCTWHTAYSNVSQGTYIAHATWNSSSGATTLSVGAASGSDPSPSPGPITDTGVLHAPALPVQLVAA